MAALPHPLGSEPEEHDPKKHAWSAVKAMLLSVHDQPNATSVHAQFDRLLDYVADNLAGVFTHLDAARDNLLAFTTFPKDVSTQIGSNNPAEGLNTEIRRRADAAGISLPRPPTHRDAIIRFVGAVPAEQTDEWVETRHYIGFEILVRCRFALVPNTSIEEVTETLALTA